MCLEMFQQRFGGIARIKDPFVKCIGIDPAVEIFFEFFLLVTLEDHFRRFETLQQFVGIFPVSFGYEEFTGRKVEESQSVLVIFRKMNSSQEIVAMVFEQFIVDRGAGSDHIGHSSFHDPFGKFGILQLVANGHPVTGPHQFV